MQFLCDTIYRHPEAVSRKYSKSVAKTSFVEIHFIVNLLCKNLIRNYKNNLEQLGAWLIIYVTCNFFR